MAKYSEAVKKKALDLLNKSASIPFVSSKTGIGARTLYRLQASQDKRPNNKRKGGRTKPKKLST